MESKEAADGAGAGLARDAWLTPRKVCRGIGNEVRWSILRELAGGEVLLVVDIAGRLGKGENAVSKHLLRMLELGLLERNRAGVYAIPERFVVSREEGVVDYGRCLLRLK